MNRKVDRSLNNAIRSVYEEIEGGRIFLDWAAARTNDAAETSIDRMTQVADISRFQAIELAKALCAAGCGEYIIGRKGWKTRVRWSFSLRSIGKAATGETVELEELDPELVEDVSDQLGGGSIDGGGTSQPLSIAEAKRRLAETFGVLPEAIEITVRA